MDYILSTGGEVWRQVGESAYEAAKQAVKDLRFSSMGVLIEAREVGNDDDDDTVYISSERLVDELGMWSQE